MKISKRTIYLPVTGFVLGLLIVLQNRSFQNVNEQFLRDTKSNVFQEIKILKEKNQDLKREITDLDGLLKQLVNQKSALGAIQEQVEKYSKIAGKTDIFGPGLEIKINGKLTTPWMIDLINEFFNSGAESVSVNGIRIVNKTLGFDTLPKGQILINGSMLSTPYVFNVIGESETLLKALETPGGIFNRLTSAFAELKIQSTRKDIIEMKASI